MRQYVLFLFFIVPIQLFAQIELIEDLEQYPKPEKSNFDSYVQQTLEELITFNRISLGDSGESSNSEVYLKQFENYVDFFHDCCIDSVLINIVKDNHSPLITTYAFVAITKKNKRVPDSLIVELIMPYANDTNSFVSLDWGCGSHLIHVFDYMLALMSHKGWDGYFMNIAGLQPKDIKELLDSRRKYYCGKDMYNRTVSWEEYAGYYLE